MEMSGHVKERKVFYHKFSQGSLFFSVARLCGAPVPCG